MIKKFNEDNSRAQFLFLPVEIRSREFLSKLLLSYEALDRHLIPIIGEAQKVLDFAVTQGCPGDIFLQKGGLEIKWVVALKSRSINLCILDEEVSPSGAARGNAARRVSSGIAQHVDLYLAADSAYEEEVSTEHPILRNRTRTVGFLRLDLLSDRIRNNLKDYYKPEEGCLKILICTGFGVTNKWQVLSASVVGFNYMIRELTQVIKSRYPPPSKYILKSFSGYLNDLKQSFDAFNHSKRFASDLDKICVELEGEEIILRPHPAEDQSLWTHAASSRDNLTVRSDIPLEIELLNASLLVHFGSTTAIQGRESGLCSVSLSSIYNWKSLNKSDEISALPVTLEEAVTLIRETSKKTQPGKELNTDSNVAHHILDCMDELRVRYTSPKDDISGRTEVDMRHRKTPQRTPIAKLLEILDIGQTRPHERKVTLEHVSAGLDALCGPDHGVRTIEVEGCFMVTRQSS